MSALRASREAARFRVRLRRAEAYIAELNELLIRLLLFPRLLDVDDFFELVGIEAVLSPEGRLNFAELEKQVADLLCRKPHLARPAVDSQVPERGTPGASDPSQSPPAEDAHQASGPRAITHPQEES